MACGDSSDELKIHIDSGVVHGVKSGTMRSFLGIPYASPPVGDLRWRAPQPVVHWDNTFEANQVGTQCPQTLSYAGPSYDENCLFINVWTPSGAKDLPVMVWLHGGAFILGSGGDKYYDGTALASHDLVIVTLNYRIGALGFFAHAALDTEDPMYPTSGNYGLEDQRFALEWVQRNIAAFGGDPTQVTLFGESAGGFSACVQYLSSRTDGLFSKTIVESGLCGAPILAQTHSVAESQGLTLADQLGCPGNDATALACLRAVDSQTIVTMTALPPATSQMPGGPLYQPSVLPNALPNVDGYVIAQPIRDLFAAHAFSPRPLVIGNNKDEGTLFHSTVYGKVVTTDLEYQAALAVRFGASNVAAIVAQYPSASFASPNDALAHVTGDAFFVCTTRRAARGALAAGASVFRYAFEQPFESAFMQGLGVFHSTEVPFVFGNDDFPLGKVGASGAPLSASLQDYWTTYAKTGDPNTGNEPAWPAYDSNDSYQQLVLPIASGTQVKAALCDFWDALPVN